MTATSTTIALIGAVGIVFTALLYLRREPGGRSRLLLMACRIGALALVVLLLLDVQVSGTDPSRPSRDGGGWILIDPDLSLSVTDPATGESLWEAAVARALEASRNGARIALATPGTGGPEGIDPSALESRAPAHPGGDLLGAVRRLAEAGADSVVLLSSFRRPLGFYGDMEASAPVPLRLDPLGNAVTNAGIGELEFPSSVSPGEPLEGTVTVFGEGGAGGEPAVVEIRANGELRRSVTIPVPVPGGSAEAAIRLQSPTDSGLVRYTARVVVEGDRFPTDDLRARWVRVGEPEGGVTLVSLLPDWESRVLLPVLEAVTGLDGSGYLRIGEDRFLPLGEDAADAGPVTTEELRGRLSGSELLVVQAGAASQLPPWLDAAMETHPRVIRLLSPGTGGDVEGLELGPSRSGEWTVGAEQPGSPLVPFLSGVRLAGLPPLGGARVVGNPESGILALRADRGNGDLDPILIFRETDAGRRAVALADGFWRWGSREGDARTAYRAIWGGTVGWLFGGESGTGGEGARPVTTVQSRGEPLRWEVPGGASSLEVALTPIHDGGDEAVMAPALSAAPSYSASLDGAVGGFTTTPPVEPGIYLYEIRDPDDAAPGTPPRTGFVDVERWAPSLRIPPLELEPGRIEAGGAGAPDSGGSGRSLRTHPLPYLLLLGFLCAEWLGRRKLGLR